MFDEEKPVKLTTFKRLEESIIEEQDVGCEKESSFKQDVDVKEALSEKHEVESSPSKENGFDEIEKHFDEIVSTFEVQYIDKQEKQRGTVIKVKPDVLPRTKK